jgi:hypothetical protein
MYQRTLSKFSRFMAIALALRLTCVAGLLGLSVRSFFQWLTLSDATSRQLSDILGPALVFPVQKDAWPFFTLHGYRATRLAVDMSCRSTWPFGVELFPVVDSIRYDFSTALQQPGSSTNFPSFKARWAVFPAS